MKKRKHFQENNLKWDIDNRICIQFPKEINVNWCEFAKPIFKVDKKTQKIIMELHYKKIKE